MVVPGDRSSGPQRVYTSASRAAGFLAKAAELSMVGVISGGLMSVGQSTATAIRRRSNPEWQPAVRTPELRSSALGMAASMGIFANMRYQVCVTLRGFLHSQRTEMACTSPRLF